MDRKKFLKTLVPLMIAGPLAISTMKLKELNKITDSLGKTQKMSVLFLGHGSPMNAIEENEFVA